LHWRNSKCAEEANLKQLSTIPQTICFPETKVVMNDVIIDELDTRVIDNICIITDL